MSWVLLTGAVVSWRVRILRYKCTNVFLLIHIPRAIVGGKVLVAQHLLLVDRVRVDVGWLSSHTELRDVLVHICHVRIAIVSVLI